MALDLLAARHRFQWRREKTWKAEVASHDGLLYCKPMSYMNLSGKPVSDMARFYKISPAETLVVVDDVALPLGKLRFRPSGSAGGHNGLKSLIEHFSTAEIPRLRIGIGSEAGDGMVSHVLGKFSPAEMPALEESLHRAAEAVEFAQTRGLQAAMNQFN